MKQPWGSLPCHAAQAIMVKEEMEVDLTPFERNCLFEHCTICDTCRSTQITILTRLLGDFDPRTDI